MKLGIIADMHLGYARFEEDTFAQAGRALRDAESKSDIILIAGDIFDAKIPKLETLKRAVDLFAAIKKPVIITHGNHERRGKDMVNSLQLLAMLAGVEYLHAETRVFELNGEKISITCMGSVPEEFAKEALKKVASKAKAEDADFRVLIIHQSIRELVFGEEEELSLDDLRELPFDLVINGHIHQKHEELGGKLIIPGSTVITQLKSDEQGERGYYIYDTGEKKAVFIPIESRLFFLEELEFREASLEEVRERIDARVKEIRKKHPDAIIKIKLEGTLKEGLLVSDLSLPFYEGVYIQNVFRAQSLSEQVKKARESLEEKLSLREEALRQLRNNLKDKISLFDPGELFEKLAEGAEEGEEYLNRKMQNKLG